MQELVELGTVSSRGQICIPTTIREHMGLEEGSKMIFVLHHDSLLIKKVTSQTFAEITKPLKEDAKKAGLRESGVDNIIARFRTSKK